MQVKQGTVLVATRTNIFTRRKKALQFLNFFPGSLLRTTVLRLSAGWSRSLITSHAGCLSTAIQVAGYPVGFVEYLGVGVADFELDNLVSYHLRLQNNFVKRLRSLQSKGEHPTNFWSGSWLARSPMKHPQQEDPHRIIRIPVGREERLRDGWHHYNQNV